MELVQQVQFSSEILVTLEKCIEFADEGSGERLAGIIRTYQVLIARMQSRHFTRSITGEERQRASEAVNWAILYRRIEDVFKYARGEVNKIPTILTEPNTHGIFYVSMRLSHNHPLSLELDGAIASTKIHKALN